jgi:hypothetical protein
MSIAPPKGYSGNYKCRSIGLQLSSNFFDSSLNVQVPDFLGMRLNKPAPGRHCRPHQHVKCAV